MSRNINNRLLLVVFLGLAVVFTITRFTSVKRSNRTLDTNIVEIDTSRVTSILLYPKAEEGSELQFLRKDVTWTISKNEITAVADAQNVKSTLAGLQNLKVDQLVARSADKWNEYQVNDSLGTRIIIKEGSRTTLDMVVGRFQYQPPPQGAYNMYGQNRGTGKTYIRKYNETEVYSVEGFLAISLNQSFDRWRDHTITRLTGSKLSRIIFDFPSDSGYVAEKNEAGWIVAGLQADSASMAKYLNSISHKSHDEFSEGGIPDGEPDYVVSFEGDNMKSQQVRAFLQQGDNLLLNSSENPETWFRITKEDLFEDLFPASSELLPGNG